MEKKKKKKHENMWLVRMENNILRKQFIADILLTGSIFLVKTARDATFKTTNRKKEVKEKEVYYI